MKICILYGYYSGGDVFKKTDNGDDLIWLSFREAIEKTKSNDASGNFQIEILERMKNEDFREIYFEEKVVSKNFV
ncbi:MAG: hypothetical protein Q9M91_01935 [Candidatus Dojkabacteria bacterium]|nr:hypothetical protein [Candidatus Dojkabacteria bacterium]MDQ7020584.1 hypothetical protein [Candidatus Dojkabacteria bacterium]